MKQSAAKTLGVVALGAAIATAGAGAANAAPAAPDAAQALGTLTQALPVENVTQALPGAVGGPVAQGQSVLGAGLESVQPAAGQVLSGGPADPAAGLLGGLPVQGKPAGKGTSVNGLPLGGAV